MTAVRRETQRVTDGYTQGVARLIKRLTVEEQLSTAHLTALLLPSSDEALRLTRADPRPSDRKHINVFSTLLLMMELSLKIRLMCFGICTVLSTLLQLGRLKIIGKSRAAFSPHP